MTIHSGGFVRKRPNLHMHVFVIHRRWQKAWLYLLLAAIHSVSAARRAVLRSFAGGENRRRQAEAG